MQAVFNQKLTRLARQVFRPVNDLPARHAADGGWPDGRSVVVTQVMVKNVLLSNRPLVRVAKAMDPMDPLPS